MKVRTGLLAVIFSLSIGGCLCAPSSPKAVTLRLKNTSRDAIYVDDTDGGLGLVVQRGVSGQYVSFAEWAPCACSTCDAICSSGGTCSCPAPDALVQKVLPGGIFERQWSGEVQIQGTQACGGFGSEVACLSPENAPYNETFNLHLCYALSATLAADSADGGAVEGVLPGDVTCVDKEFHIDDGVAEIGPQRGADCVTTADCKGVSELCFSGACTASCPANDYPSEAESSLRISIDDTGFFTSTVDGMKTTYVGAGTIGSATYNSSSLRLFLTRLGSSGEALTATINLDVPRAMQLGPLSAGQKVSVRVVDNSPADAPTSNAGMAIRDETGALLVIADSDLTAPDLAAADLAPFSVTIGATPTGCRMTGCGKELFTATGFTDGMKSVTLEPGQSANLVNTLGTYRAVNVFAGQYDSASPCDVKVIRPYIIWRDKPPGG
jgi:hypothetical protein